MIRSVNFLLTLAAVVAATLLVTPLPAVAETEAPNPPSATPLEVERTPVEVAGLAPTAVCSATTAGAPATDIDPKCFDGCYREYRRCLAAVQTWQDPSSCGTALATCESDCIYGSEYDPDNPWYGALPSDTASGNDCSTPGTEGCDEIRNHEDPRGGASPSDSEGPRRPSPHNF